MSKKTAMQALVDLLKVNDIYKECMPYIIEIIKEVYLPMEREQIVEAWNSGDYAYFYSKETGREFEDGSEYYNETYKGGEQ